MKSYLFPLIAAALTALPAAAQDEGIPKAKAPGPWVQWERPAENAVFATDKGNNHDAVFFVEEGQAYPYHLIISHDGKAQHLWRAKKFSWDSKDWELVSDQYKITKQYELDDGVKVGDTYYIYENGVVYTLDGKLEDGSGKWKRAGKFPKKEIDDIGVFYEDGVFHLFGEYGKWPHGPDGTSLAHYTSTTGLGDWKLVNPKAADPNPDGGDTYGVGDPTIAKIDGAYYIFCDLESQEHPYRVSAWRSPSLDQPFEYLGVAVAPRTGETAHWDNYRVQDPDIEFVPELGRWVMFANVMDKDGTPGGKQKGIKGGGTRVIGAFYSREVPVKPESDSTNSQ